MVVSASRHRSGAVFPDLGHELRSTIFRFAPLFDSVAEPRGGVPGEDDRMSQAKFRNQGGFSSFGRGQTSLRTRRFDRIGLDSFGLGSFGLGSFSLTAWRTTAGVLALGFGASSAQAQESGGEGSASFAVGGEVEADQPKVEASAEASSSSPSEPASAEPTDSDATGAASGVPAYAGARATRSTTSVKERFAQKPYMQRYKPEGNLWEIGMFGGILFPSKNHNLNVVVLPREEYSPLAGQLGGRFAYLPLSWLGLELEGFGAGGSTKDTDFSAVFYSLRAHALFQLPFWSVAPFALVGAGAWGGASESMGHDRDPEIHFGGGVKVPFSHRVMGRFDVRDILSQKTDANQGVATHNPEIHLGISFVFERTVPDAPSDADYDGLYDSEDECPQEGALTVNGCPGDSDADGISDPKDACPLEPAATPDGCPEKDADGDGVLLPADQCPEEAGPAPSGCPDKDQDGDGILGAADQCPDKPENRNGFQDDDGCPDEMPEAVSRFTGVIQGINFKQGTSEIEKSSYPTLDSVVGILKEHPSVRLEISGHTSSEGTEQRNQELSDERAGSVRKYIVEHGIEEDRIVARGAGASEPIADNATKEGREANRRIEFRVLSQR